MAGKMGSSMPANSTDGLVGEAGEAGIGIGNSLLQSRDGSGCGRSDIIQGPGGSLADREMGRSADGPGQTIYGGGSFGLESP